MDEETEILSFLTETLGDFVFSLQDLMSETEQAPSSIKPFLEKICGDPKQLIQYLQKHTNRFFLENEKVTVYDPDLEVVREKTVSFFEDKLNLLGKPCNYVEFRGYISQAENDVQNFIQCFYPGDTFKQLLLAHPRVFILLENDTVFLIENETVDYLEQCLEENSEGLPYLKLLNCVSQAPKHVMKFINDYYPEEHFLQLLEKNSDVFRIEEGCVYLKDDEL